MPFQYLQNPPFSSVYTDAQCLSTMWRHRLQPLCAYLLVLPLLNNLLGHTNATPLSTRPKPSLPMDDFLVANSLLNTPVVAHEVVCGYEISGMYCKMQRMLFYIVAIITFCFCFHKWLTAIGVAYCVTYSIVTSLHIFSLSVTDSDALIALELCAVSATIAMNFMLFTPRKVAHRMRIALFGWCLFPIMAMSISVIRYTHGYVAVAVEVCSLNTDDDCMDTCRTGFPSSIFRSKGDAIKPIFIQTQLNISMTIFNTIDDLFSMAMDLTRSFGPMHDPWGPQNGKFGLLSIVSAILISQTVLPMVIHSTFGSRYSRNLILQVYYHRTSAW